MSRLVAAPPPNRVRSPTDRQFASGCSPRRFEPTQLPLASELWHTPARTFTVLMWRPHRRTHSRMSLAGIQAKVRLDPQSKHSGVNLVDVVMTTACRGHSSFLHYLIAFSARSHPVSRSSL